MAARATGSPCRSSAPAARCEQCLTGNHQVCERQTQPGFTGWGSFAELVALDHADVNLVGLPDEVDAVDGRRAGLPGRHRPPCRAWRRGGCSRGQWVAVHGCGGVGLSAVMVARRRPAPGSSRSTSAPGALELARQLRRRGHRGRRRRTTSVRGGARGDRRRRPPVAGRPRQPRRPAPRRCRCLRTRGRHVQVGLLPPDLGHPAVPMARVIALRAGARRQPRHGGARLPGACSRLVAAGRLRPDLLVTRRIGLDEAGRRAGRDGGAGLPGRGHRRGAAARSG